MAKRTIIIEDDGKLDEPNTYGEGSAGEIIINLKKRAGAAEVWRKHNGYEGRHTMCQSMDHLLTTIQAQIRLVLSDTQED